MKDICEATQLSGEEELEVSQKSSPTRPFLDQRRHTPKPLSAREKHLGVLPPDQSAFQGFRLVGEMFLSK